MLDLQKHRASHPHCLLLVFPNPGGLCLPTGLTPLQAKSFTYEFGQQSNPAPNS